MTFEELDALYPNGFVDAYLEKVSLDYQKRTAELRILLRGNPPESPLAREYRPALLVLRSFYYFVIEPPDNDHFLIQSGQYRWTATLRSPRNFRWSRTSRPMFLHECF